MSDREEEDTDGEGHGQVRRQQACGAVRDAAHAGGVTLEYRPGKEPNDAACPGLHFMRSWQEPVSFSCFSPCFWEGLGE